MDGIFSTKLKKSGKSLIHIRQADDVRYREFIASLEEGTEVELFMEINNADGTLAQLAKVHKCIRTIASQTGHSFEDIKLVIKDRSGLLIKRTVMNKEYIDWKSFGDCSRDELNLAIQACIDMGDDIGVNLR